MAEMEVYIDGECVHSENVSLPEANPADVAECDPAYKKELLEELGIDTHTLIETIPDVVAILRKHDRVDLAVRIEELGRAV